MTWLKKIGSVIVKAAELAGLFQPLITGVVSNPQGQQYIRAVSDDLTKIAGAVTTAETMGQALSLPGTQKLQAATPLVVQILLDADFITGQHIDNQTLFQQGAGKIADGMADVLNSLKA